MIGELAGLLARRSLDPAQAPILANIRSNSVGLTFEPESASSAVSSPSFVHEPCSSQARNGRRSRVLLLRRIFASFQVLNGRSLRSAPESPGMRSGAVPWRALPFPRHECYGISVPGSGLKLMLSILQPSDVLMRCRL